MENLEFCACDDDQMSVTTVDEDPSRCKLQPTGGRAQISKVEVQTIRRTG